MIIAETERLTISKITLKEAPFFVELMNTPSFLKYIGDRNIKTIHDAELYLNKGILKSYEEHGFSYYKLKLKEDRNKIIGIVGLLKRKQLLDADIGFSFLPEFEGKGYGYEASVVIIKLAKETFKLKRIVAITNTDNNKSIKLIEKLGLTFEKRVKPFDDDEELLLFAKTL